MDILGKLFGSDSKVKIMRLFLFNPEMPFSAEMVADRTKAGLFTARQELSNLRQMKLIKHKSFITRIQRGKKDKQKECFPYRPQDPGWRVTAPLESSGLVHED